MRIIAFFIALFMLGGCAAPIEESSAADEPIELKQVSLNLNSEKVTELKAKYEPKENVIYKGAYIYRDLNVNGEIADFEEKTGISHDIYAKDFHLGDEKISDFMLECLAKEKIPYIILIPPTTGENIYDLKLLQKSVQSLKSFDMPVFVEVYPLEGRYRYNNEVYIEFFKQAWTQMYEIAPNAAIVFGADRAAEDMMKYYPGDEFVDWVSVSALKLMEDSTARLIDDLNRFADNFKDKKPLMVRVGVAHYSTLNHKYQTTQANESLKEIYLSIKENYPSIKGVVYMNYDSSKNAPKLAIRSNFTISGESEQIKGYNEAVKSLN